jgi:4-hydroxythreonine-4-phosphate dehydrogenase
MSTLPIIAITCGEPAGIGPEIAIRAAWQLRHVAACILIGDAALLSKTASAIDSGIELASVLVDSMHRISAEIVDTNRLHVIDCPLAVPVTPGVLDVRNAPYVLHCLDSAIDLAQRGWCDAVVTGPLQKSIINDAGFAFTGHTEYLAQKTNTDTVVMMLAADATSTINHDQSQNQSHEDLNTVRISELSETMPPLRVALATTHLPLKEVAASLTQVRLTRIMQIIHADLQTNFGIAKPCILVAGLNPHAGENGYLGREEIDVIEPVIAAQREQGIDVRGPYPADTLFQPKYLREADCVLAMYHDQGLPVLKFASFGRGVNITLGLPIIRTSVDHGTALDLAAAGLGKADFGSMVEAVLMAKNMAHARSHFTAMTRMQIGAAVPTASTATTAPTTPTTPTA